MEKTTPLMKQYWDIKSQHEDKIVLFRMGDFYEMFFEDAKTAAPILGIALTQRNKKSQDETPMCGVPHHSIAGPINKLLQAGLRVAMCNQIEDPALAKGLVKRAVTRVLTPGMVYDPDTLESHEKNFLCAFDAQSVAFLETSTGEAFFYLYHSVEELIHLLELWHPRELVLTAQQLRFAESLSFGTTNSVFEKSHAEQLPDTPDSARRLLAYAESLQGPVILETLRPFEHRSLQGHLKLSATVVRHLELVHSNQGEKRGSLFFATDRSRTAQGARLLKSWLLMPLTRQDLIEVRLNEVEQWTQKPDELQVFRRQLTGLGDIERRLAKVAQAQCSPRDLQNLAAALETGLSLPPHQQTNLIPQESRASVKNWIEKVQRALVEDAPAQRYKDFFVRPGFRSDLDEYIELTTDSQKALMEMEVREKQATGISSLKIKYNQVFGYYIEVTNTNLDKVPIDRYQRRQTLTQGERFVTEELQKLEDKILSAGSKRREMENQILEDLKNSALKMSPAILSLSQAWAEVDALTALAWLALENNYVRPRFSQDRSLKLVDCRHPVVEQLRKEPFTANSLSLAKGECLLLTGPNMAGKSTFMRQIALHVILAQMGSFVPSREAELPLYTQIFTRIGASDSLSQGLSTFMVEMQETAEILSGMDQTSFLILDEIGRGTSTFDGMSLAQAILEYLLRKTQSTVFFATHFHELTQLQKIYPQVRNAHMAIHERRGQIQFLYSLQEGPANKSYGIEVAQIAGLPAELTRRAREILKAIESGTQNQTMDLFNYTSPIDRVPTEVEESPEINRIGQMLEECDPNNLSPREALEILFELKSRMEEPKNRVRMIDESINRSSQ